MSILDNQYTWKDEDGPQGYNWEDLHPKMMEIGGSKEFVFEVERQKDDGAFLSVEAVEAVARGCMTFLLSRQKYHYDATGKAAKKARITIKVELED